MPTNTATPVPPLPTPLPEPNAAATPIPTPPATPTPRPTPKPSLPSLHNTQNARWVQQSHSTLHEGIIELSWVSDGLDGIERVAIDDLLYIAVVDPKLTHELLTRHWLRDGIDATEAAVLEEYYFVSQDDVSVAELLISMPFMSSVEAADLHALAAINDIVRERHAASLTGSQVFRAGITDEWTPVIAAAGAVNTADTLREYLDVLAVTVEEEVYTIHGEPMTITIVHPSGSIALQDPISDAFEAVIAVEIIMQLPLPKRHVVIVFDSRAVSVDAFGTNHGYAISIEDEDPLGGPSTLRSALYHELAHYWWRGNVNWIDEGIADTIATTVSLFVGDVLESRPNRRQECTTQNVSSLGHTRQSDEQFHCNYYLGEKLSATSRKRRPQSRSRRQCNGSTR